jgi:AcrR family transcriptional regulator
MTKRRTQIERSGATTMALRSSASKLFGALGYEATSLDEICASANVTKGALYHHFPTGKIALFEAVVIMEQEQVLSAMAAASQGAATGELALRAVLATYFEVALKPGIYRITLLDAPAVLGLERWREIEYRYAQRFIREAVDRALGTTKSDDYRKMLSSALFGSACELTLTIAGSDDADQAGNHAIDIMVTLFAAALRKR